MKNTCLSPLTKLLGLALGLALLPTVALAQTFTWDGGGSDNNWTTGDNWVGNVAPTGNTAEILVFDGTTQLTTNNDFAAGTSFERIEFGASAGDFVIDGNRFEIGNSGGPSPVLIDNASAPHTVTINADIDINEGIPELRGDNDATYNLNGQISATGAVDRNHQIDFRGGDFFLNNANNDYHQGTGTRNGGAVFFSDLQNQGVNSEAGAGDYFKIGHGNSDGVIVYQGGAASTDRFIRVGLGTSAAHDGGGIFRNNGSGAITFTGTEATNTQTGVIAERELTFAGSFSGTNVIQGEIQDMDTAAGGILSLEIIDDQWELQGANTYTGDTTVDATSTLTLADDGELVFVIGADGVNNAILGDGTANIDGDFVFDLTNAGDTIGDSWSIVASSLTEIFGATFTVDGFTDAGGGIWTFDDSGTTYEFDEGTGALTVIPEPSAIGLLLGGASLGLLLRRPRR